MDVETENGPDRKKRKVYSCSCCSKTFTDSKILRRHVRQKHRDVDVNRVCPYKRRITELSSDPKEGHKCNECSAAFVLDSSLRRHVRSKHPSIVPRLQSTEVHKCNECCKAFVLNSSLRRHVRRKHPSIVPCLQSTEVHKCNECCKAFVLNSSLFIYFKFHYTNYLQQFND